MKQYRLYGDLGQLKATHDYWFHRPEYVSGTHQMFALAKAMVDDGCELMDLQNFLMQEMYTIWGAATLNYSSKAAPPCEALKHKRPKVKTVSINITSQAIPATRKKLKRKWTIKNGI